MFRLSWMFLLLTFMSAAVAFGQTTAPAPETPTPAQLSRLIQTQLNSPADRSQAPGNIRKLFELDATTAAGQLRGNWLKLLLDGKEYKAVDELAVRGILANPADTAGIEYFLNYRVRALRGAGDNEQALAVAKVLFNVCSMTTTGAALVQITECLNAANPGDLQIATVFKNQQQAGAVQPASVSISKPTTMPAGGSILLAIKVEPQPFAGAAKQIFAEDYQSLLGKGNLLLLANSPVEARGVFERAYGVAPDGVIAQATENVARAMKAQDGSIGRANAWLVSLRPDAQNKPDNPKVIR